MKLREILNKLYYELTDFGKSLLGYWPDVKQGLRVFLPLEIAKTFGYNEDEYRKFSARSKHIYDRLIETIFHPINSWPKTKLSFNRIKNNNSRYIDRFHVDEKKFKHILDLIIHPQKHWPETKNNVIDFKARNWSKTGEQKVDFEHFVQGMIQPVKMKAASLRHYRMPVDVWECGDKYILRADIPGYRKEDIDISACGHCITLAVSENLPSSSANEEAGTYVIHERKHGLYTRIIELPQAINLENLTAEYFDGVVKIEVSKQAQDNNNTVHVSL